MRKVNGEGSYTRKGTGEEIVYSYEYPVLESTSDVNEGELLAIANRMLKVDANNVAREKAKAANGDSTARVLTPEEKERRKAERHEQGAIIKALKAKGFGSLADIEKLLK